MRSFTVATTRIEDEVTRTFSDMGERLSDLTAEIRAFGIAAVEADRRIRVNLKRAREAALSELK